MEKKKFIYFIWDSKNVDRMKRILTEMGTNDDIIEQLVDLDLKDGTAVVPYTNGYSTYYGFDLDESEYELYKDTEDTRKEGPTEETCKDCSAENCTDRVVEYEPKDKSKCELKDNREEVTEVDIDDILDEYEVTEDPDEAIDMYAKIDPEYDEALEALRVLLHVRDEYRATEEDAMAEAIGGFKEGDSMSLDFSILSTEDGFKVVETDYPSIFSFATEKMAQKFLDNFEGGLDKVCDDLGYFM